MELVGRVSVSLLRGGSGGGAFFTSTKGIGLATFEGDSVALALKPVSKKSRSCASMRDGVPPIVLGDADLEEGVG